jgi:acyl-CoA thioesterase
MERQAFLETILSILNSSPYYRHMGMKAVHCADGTSRIEIQADEHTKNLYGTVHGGVLASLIDSSCGVALGTLLEEGETAVTVDLRINYIAPVRAGLLIAEGKAIHRGRNTGVAEATLHTEGGVLVAKGMTTHFIQKTS